ncbi:MAG: T9SS type A sorting domain-containing protein [Ignavibacteria bacterium]|nr:T9SS type A sorting domain-containing protein [Ignavibacteria bacterium]
MKTFILISGFISLFIFSSFTNSQIPGYKLIAKYFDHPKFTGNYVTFDIFLINTDTVNFEYAGGEYVFDFYTPVGNGGDLIYEIHNKIYQPNLPYYLRPVDPQVHIGAGDTSQFSLSQNVFPGAGRGFIVPQNIQGVRVIKMSLYSTAQSMLVRIDPPSTHMIDLRLRWKNIPDLLSTKIYAYVNDTLTDITNPSMHFIDSSGLQIFPVELISFTNSVNDNIVTLNWTTASEINNSGFEIHRKLYSSEEWINVGFVSGHGTTNDTKNYTFTDKVNIGKYNYRLKQNDFNGNFEYFLLNSNVNIGIPSKFSLSQNYPNPFNPSTAIDFRTGEDEFITISLYDNLGRFAGYLLNEYRKAGYYSLNIDMSNRPGGIYYYKFESGQFREVRKMVYLK